MNLPILQQKPHTREVPSKKSQQKNDVLSNIATNTMEFLQDISSGSIEEKLSLSWYDKNLFKNNRIFYIGLIFLIIAILIFISNKKSEPFSTTARALDVYL